MFDGKIGISIKFHIGIHKLDLKNLVTTMILEVVTVVQKKLHVS